MEERDDGFALQSCDPTTMDCKDCVWAFVYGLKPIAISCGKYQRKPKGIYYNGQKCPYKEPLGEKNGKKPEEE